MTVSGIYVRIDPQHWGAATESLRQLPGVDLHQSDDSTGRLVLTHDADSTDSQTAGIERIRRIRGVVTAEPVYYYLDDEEKDDASDCQPDP